MKDLGHLTYFLGLEISRSNRGILVSQRKYTKDLLALASLTDQKTVQTPLELNVHYGRDDGDLLPQPDLYRRLVGSLVYLTM
ncbi:hypothetical protein PJP10_31490, partial [Mycobacterium kansasii]